MKKIIIVMLGLSIALLADFTKEGDIVTDSITKLEWQDDAITDKMEWQEAIDYCESLELAGYTDWRLPNINELKTIIDRSRYDPAIVSIFEYTSSSCYWSATIYEYDYEYVWSVYFSVGIVGANHKDNDNYVRCVRDGQ